MRKANKVDIWINGKKIKQTQNGQAPDTKNELNDPLDEHAATVEDSHVPETIANNSDRSHAIETPRKSTFKTFKPILFAVLAALVIGSLLGFFLLNMFVGINSDMGPQGAGPPAVGKGESDDNAIDDRDNSSGKATSDITIDASSAFVLQAGKFKKQANAEDKAEAYHSEDYPAVVWEKEGAFHVLSGIANAQQQLDKKAKKMTEDDMDVYVKKWETPSADVNLSTSEKEWLQMYRKQWKASLGQVSADKSMSSQNWSEIASDIPDDTETLADFAAFVQEEQSRIEEADKWEDQEILLRLWKQFDKELLQ